MGDILSKLQMVSEKIGVTETAHTIEEQVDLISESLDKIPASTNIAEALDDLSEVAQNINNDEVYIDKTITENGTYLPAYDEATAYSKVVVDVPVPSVSTNEYSIQSFSGIVLPNNLNNLWAISSDNGIIDNSWDSTAHAYKITGNGDDLPKVDDPVCFLICKPLKKFINPSVGVSAANIYFTPDLEFDGFYGYYYHDNEKYTISGDAITSGDGYVYKAEVNFTGGTINIVKTTALARVASVE